MKHQALHDLHADIVKVVQGVTAESGILDFRGAVEALLERHPNAAATPDDVAVAVLRQATLWRIPVVFAGRD